MKMKTIHYIYKLYSCLVILFLLSACSTRLQPAPVTHLSTKIASTENLTEISGERYQVKAGDTLFAIAFYSGNDYRDLAKLNNLTPPYTIKIGQELLLSPPSADKLTKNPEQIKLTSASSKIDVDQEQQQAYGVGSKKDHRKKLDIAQKSSNKTDKDNKKSINGLSWIWPAQGQHTVATVGSDGSLRGLDIKGAMGAKVLAAAPGRVVYAGNALKGYGNLVIIKHDDNYLSAYAHNSSIIVGEQSYVSQGQQIATMGNSGASDVMLHFEIRRKGKSVDPFNYLPQL